MADPVYDDDGIDRITLTFAVVLANRYSWAICMKRARRAVISALRASSVAQPNYVYSKMEPASNKIPGPGDRFSVDNLGEGSRL